MGSIEARGFSAAACGQLADVRGDARGVVAGRQIARQVVRRGDYVGIGGCGSARLALGPQTHATKKPGVLPREAVATQGR